LDESIYEVNRKLVPKPGTKVKFIVDGSPLVQLYVLISGKVQGVGFRDFTRQTADQMNVYGYVKNLPNGKVEAVLAGQEANVNKLLEKLHVGPRSAKVTDVKTEKREFTGKYKDFQIHR
jgi:acylphosphatase